MEKPGQITTDSLGERIYNKIFQNATVGIVLFSNENRVIFCNDLVRSLTGYGAEEFEGTRFFDLLLEDEIKIQSCLKQVSNREAEKIDFDLRIKYAGGADIELNIAASPFTFEGNDYFLVAIQDITNRRAFESVLESSFDNFIQTTIDLDAALKKISEQREQLNAYKVRVEREMAVAQRVQKSLIPRVFPHNDTIEVYGISKPSSELGGDYLDVFDLGNNRLGILIADVSGHGVGSALIAAMSKVFFTNHVKKQLQPDEVMRSVNGKLKEFLGNSGQFLTAAYSIIDLHTLDITTCLGAHANPIYYSEGQDQVLPLGSPYGGSLLGVLKDEQLTFEQHTTTLTPGTTLLYCTDGIYEATNAEGEMYGYDRMYSLLKRSTQAPAEKIVNDLLAEVQEFIGGSNFRDDQSIIVVKLKDKASKAAPTNMHGLYNRGQLFFEKRNYGQAAEHFQLIIEENPDSMRAYFFLGLTYIKLRKFAEAEESFQTTINLNPNYYNAYYYQGIALFNQRKYKKALAVWTDLKQTVGDFKKLNEYMGMVKSKINEMN